jgi:hypothetical protein
LNNFLIGGSRTIQRPAVELGGLNLAFMISGVVILTFKIAGKTRAANPRFRLNQFCSSSCRFVSAKPRN